MPVIFSHRPSLSGVTVNDVRTVWPARVRALLLSKEPSFFQANSMVTSRSSALYRWKVPASSNPAREAGRAGWGFGGSAGFLAGSSAVAASAASTTIPAATRRRPVRWSGMASSRG